jgi:hypothetical protein
MKRSMIVLFAVAGLPQLVAGQAIRKKCQAEVSHQPTACIMSPAEGSTLKKANVKVVLASAGGVNIAPVAAAKAGGAHYHIFLDVDPSPDGEPIPQGPGITHMGNGAKEFMIENVAPGSHRIIVILGDNSHVPVRGQKADTTYFQVAGR